MDGFRRRCLLLGVAVLAAAGVAVYLYHHKPGGGAGFHPQCTVSRLTGFDCAGCGMTRAAHELLHLRFGAAFRYNPLLVGALPLVAGWLGLAVAAWLWGDRYRGPRVRLTRNAALVLVTVVLLYSILRNVPAWPFTLLAPHGG